MLVKGHFGSSEEAKANGFEDWLGGRINRACSYFHSGMRREGGVSEPILHFPACASVIGTPGGRT